jgi:hypothetical protein
MGTHDDILENIYKIRGYVLQRAIEIESLLDVYIAEYFTQDEAKVHQLVSLLLAPRMSFMNKFDVFTYLVDIKNPEFRTNFPKFPTQLKLIIEERNVFAHYPADFSPHAVETFKERGVIKFVKLKNSKNHGLTGVREIAEETINITLQVMAYYADALKNLVGIDTTIDPE